MVCEHRAFNQFCVQFASKTEDGSYGKPPSIQHLSFIESSPEKAALYHLVVTLTTAKGVWNEGNAGASTITVRSS
jgi:hypothetical protein